MAEKEQLKAEKAQVEGALSTAQATARWLKKKADRIPKMITKTKEVEKVVEVLVEGALSGAEAEALERKVAAAKAGRARAIATADSWKSRYGDLQDSFAAYQKAKEGVSILQKHGAGGGVGLIAGIILSLLGIKFFKENL